MNSTRTSPTIADDLAAANLLYRDPGMHDYLQGAATRDTDVVHHAVDTWASHAESLLDAGCGTGALVAALSDRLAGLGIDLQPQLIAHARHEHPGCDFEVGELCTLDLGRRFDVITCLGNVLAYLHEPEELDAATATMSRHARPGTIVVINTLITPPPAGPASTSCVATARGPVQVTVQNHWDDDAQVATMTRRWTFSGGRTETDLVHRRVHDLNALTAALTGHGFQVRTAFDTLATTRNPPRGPSAYIIAQRTGADPDQTRR
ncbi:class I SAM-dependent methyltransferase [Myceligenerans pegani]|uniref:Class I SAM-dependent methyltransferase n=1 Tax=Myceligenerans pegani TaxID=2776917 RepID=A0ABR9MZ14_9MICO|nr:class I SAM-dependent methyltransferase [Myceligenerans sp. TRM 65318]MBE1876617.1 class I SAM-dependent methyltransferase [Myceligenerans sp. TRM 65318]MBE3018888.1 class I SAM-dependent methyltransferase [Myceligenerans sp. TRM 65318]